ncbi:glycosyltransferase [Paenibacillus sp. NPDC057934]|uniref:glycosyltransferase n=1 Tax=Paenibacillus sp. NPDC057934 TaxID=3346282 RepID=UPI0036D99427
MQVSVIIAVYNRASLLPDLLEHWRKVDEVTKYEYELIFSDDESSDESVAILNECQDLPIRVLTNAHGGAAKARNHAYQYATGEIIIFTGDDIFPTVNFVNEHYESYLKNGKNYATLGCIDWRDGIQMNHLMKHITDIGCEQFGFVGMRPFEVIDFRHFYTSNVSVSREQLQKLDGLFDLAFKKYGFEDIELGYRLHKNGVQIMYNPNALGYHDHIYNSVDKFCNRQHSAGEELNTFKMLHPEIGLNELKFDLDEFHQKYGSYAAQNRTIDIVGDLGRLLIFFMKKSTGFLEKILLKKDSFKIKKLSSKFYSAIFSYYMYLGIAQGYKEGNPSKTNSAQRFTFRYLYFGKSQIFYDKDNNFSEQNSVFYRTTGEKELTISSKIPTQFLGRIRFDPLDDHCKVKLLHAYVYLKDGSKQTINFEYNNAKKVKNKVYDFSNQTDPILISELLPNNTESIEIKFKMNYLLRKRVYSALTKGIRLSKKLLKNIKQPSNKETLQKNINVIESNLEKKKIWITLTGLPEQDLIPILNTYKQISNVYLDLSVDINACQSSDYSEYIYEINHKDHALEKSQFMNAAFCLLEFDYDFILLSDSLASFPTLNGHSLKESAIISRRLAPFNEFIKGSQTAIGKFIRIPGSRRIGTEINLTHELPILKAIDEKTLYINQPRELLQSPNLNLEQYKKDKPLVFVLPVFMAVGGVERNTIEIMERLKNQYDFVVISFERHRIEQGSLFYQVAELELDYYDLAEISEFNKYIERLKGLKHAYTPDLVWICNSSPWMMENTVNIRKVFNDAAIVVQDVYDYEYGWIQYYDRPAIHSYDRFIAINQKIKEKFENVYGIDQKRIDLVYSAVDTQKILEASSSNFSRTQVLTGLGLDPEKMYFAFVGRFTEQKQPLKILQLAKYIIEAHDNVDFIMVGDGELSTKVSEVLDSDNNLKKRIHRIKYISEVSKFIKAIDGLVIASIFEGLPIVTIEAMCVGTPIFSTDVGDIALFVNDKNIGVVSATQEINALQKDFDKFYSNLKMYKENSLNHINENIEFFSSQRAAELMNQSFQSALEKYKS